MQEDQEAGKQIQLETLQFSVSSRIDSNSKASDIRQIPAMFASYKLINNISEQDSWKIIFKSRWMEYIFLGLFAYGIIHYLFCWLMMISVGDSTLFTYWRIRGDSGLRMLGYATAAVILYRFWRSQGLKITNVILRLQAMLN